MFFDTLKADQKSLIYQGLKHLVEEGNPSVFHNGDAGHPIYLDGAENRDGAYPGYTPDSPEINQTFLMHQELSLEMKEDFFGYIWWHDFSTWQKFCQFAVDKYNDRRGHGAT